MFLLTHIEFSSQRYRIFLLAKNGGYPRTPVHSISFQKETEPKENSTFPHSPFYIERGSNSGFAELQPLIPFGIAGRRDGIVL